MLAACHDGFNSCLAKMACDCQVALICWQSNREDLEEETSTTSKVDQTELHGFPISHLFYSIHTKSSARVKLFGSGNCCNVVINII